MKPKTYTVKWRPDPKTPWVIFPNENKDDKQYVSKVILEVRCETVKNNLEATGHLSINDETATIKVNDDI